MIITRTPLRISFFGGGTDYPTWFEKNKGKVLATTIDKYVYITLRYLPPFFEHRLRIVWSITELVKHISEIKHPAVREALRFMRIKKGVEIHCDGDLPARTGLGSSSSFTVGILNGLYALKGKMVSKLQLAQDAIYVEQEMIRENVGCQDQISAAFGGFNLIEFNGKNDFRVQTVTLSKEKRELFQKHLMLIFTGFSRTASEIAGELIKKMPEKEKELTTMCEMVDEGLKIISGNSPLSEFGKLLHESWKLKQSLTNVISTTKIDEIYSIARKAGAIGGKLCGAGGGGFLLLFAEPGVQSKIKSKLKQYLHVPFQLENLGSQVIFYTPEK